MHAMDVIHSLKIILQGGNSGRALHQVCSGGYQECAPKEETYPAKTGNIDGSVKNHSSSLDCCVNHS